MKGRGMIVWAVAALCAASGGCGGSDERLAALAQTTTQQQAEQNVTMAETTRAVTEGSKALVEAEARARQELIVLQQDLRGDQAELGRQREVLEQQREALDQRRRTQAATERRESLLAPAIVTLGLLLACIAPLIVAGFSLVGLYIEPTHEEGEALLTELWLELQEPARAATEASPRIEQVETDEDPLLPLLVEAEQ